MKQELFSFTKVSSLSFPGSLNPEAEREPREPSTGKGCCWQTSRRTQVWTEMMEKHQELRQVTMLLRRERQTPCEAQKLQLIQLLQGRKTLTQRKKGKKRKNPYHSGIRHLGGLIKGISLTTFAKPVVASHWTSPPQLGSYNSCWGCWDPDQNLWTTGTLTWGRKSVFSQRYQHDLDA